MRGLYMYVNRKWQEVLEFPRFYATKYTFTFPITQLNPSFVKTLNNFKMIPKMVLYFRNQTKFMGNFEVRISIQMKDRLRIPPQPDPELFDGVDLGLALREV